MIHGSLFSGIGGFDLAAEYVGWTNAFCCERDEFCQKVLSHHFPGSQLYNDVREFKADKYLGRIDVLSGGFPCQPFSGAGKREGSNDERHLWPEMRRIIGECKPKWVVGENVLGFATWSDGMVLEESFSDLEAMGYAVESYIIPACGVNAPHKRDRVWIVAHTEHHGRLATEGRRGDGTDSERSKEGQEGSEQFKGVLEPEKLGGVHRYNSNNEPVTTYSDRYGLQGRDVTGQRTQQPQPEEPAAQRVPPSRRRLRFEDFPTVAPICSGDDGLPSELDGITFPRWRRESVKAYGNAVCVPVVINIFNAIKSYERNLEIPRT